MDETQDTKATTPAPKPAGLPLPPPAEEFDLKQILEEYGRPVAYGIALAIALYVGITLYRYQTSRSAAEAMALLNSARGPEQLQAVVTDYPRSPSAPVALLSLAREKFNQGKYAEARADYEKFVANYRRHVMFPVARLGLAMCDEARGSADEALKQFAALATEYTDDVVRPQALFGRARCLDQAGKTDEARAIYEDFITQHAESPWKGTAEAALDALKLGKGLTRVAPAAAVVPATPVAPAPVPAVVPSPAPVVPGPAATNAAPVAP